MSSPSPRFARRPLAESDPREPKIVLGSSSKFRKQILADMGYSFVTMNPDIDERAITYVCNLAWGILSHASLATQTQRCSPFASLAPKPMRWPLRFASADDCIVLTRS